MNFLIVGAGYTGRRVLDALPAGQTRGLSRSLPKDCAVPVDLMNLDDTVEAPLSFPHEYAVLYTVPPATDSDSDHRLQQFLQILTPGVRRIVYLSTSGVYGDRDGELVAESDAVRPQSARAKRRVMAERMLENWCATANVELITLRVAGIYGPDRLGLDRIREGQPLIDVSEAGPGNRIHVDDLAACCVSALQAANAGGIYNICDGDHRSSTEFAIAVAEIAGLEPPPQVLRATAESTFSAMRLSFLKESRTLDNSRMRAALLPELRFAKFEEGIRASLPAGTAT